MSDEYTHTGLSLVGKHVPDHSMETMADGTKAKVELPGHYYVGVVIDGVFKPLAKYGAAGLFADIERAKQANGEQV